MEKSGLVSSITEAAIEDELTSRNKLYEAIQVGLDQVKDGNTKSWQEMMEKIKKNEK